MTTRKALSLIVLSVLITACGRSSLSLRELNALRKGMTTDSVAKLLPIRPTNVFNLDSIPSYIIHSYPLTIEVFATGGSAGGMGGASAPMPTTYTSINGAVLLIFGKSGLRYWGMMGDIQKSEDVEMQELAPRLNGIR